MKKTYKTIKTYRKDLGPDSSQISENEVNEYITNETSYDENNNVISDINFNPQGEIEQKYEYKYNAEGKIIEELLYYENGELADKKQYEYNEKGLIAKELVFYMDESFDTIQYNYDADMNLIEKTTISSEGNTEEKEIFEYRQGQIILHAIFDGEKNKFYETTYKYNAEGKVTELIEWDSESDKKNKTLNTYNENNILIKQLRYINDDLVAKLIFILDENGKVFQVLDEDVNHTNTINITHDANGNITEELEVNLKGELNHKISRAYNEYNDLLESRVYMDPHNGNPIQNYIIRHEYEYRD